MYQINVGITKNKVGIINIKVGITKNKVGIISIKVYILKQTKKGEMAPKPFRTLWNYPYKAQKQCYQNNSSIVIGFSQSDGQRIFKILLSPKLKIGMCCLSDKHPTLRRNSKDWLDQSQDNVS